jgi:hypothetical protein
VTALDALWFVHAKDFTAFVARPGGSFVCDELLHAHLLDALQIRDGAYPVLGLVAVVKMPQFSTGKVAAGVAILIAAGRQFFAVLDNAVDACIGLVAVISSTTGAGVAISNVRAAEGAIQATRRDEHQINNMNSQVSVRHGLPLIPIESVASSRPTDRS